MSPFILIAPATRGLSLALTRHFLRTTTFPVYATHRSESADTNRDRILSPLKDVNPHRLTLLTLDLESEQSIASAADALAESLPDDAESHIHTAVFAGGVLHVEKQSADLDAAALAHTFQVNVISHLLLIKHFGRFLPPSKARTAIAEPAKWVHVSARVGSIADNARGGWYSYRASKAALNQVIKTFDLQLKVGKRQAMCVGVHPGTVKTGLSKGFWAGVGKDKLFEPEDAAEKVIGVIKDLKEEQRGRIWDWAGKEVAP